jgi:hypothetical protein
MKRRNTDIEKECELVYRQAVDNIEEKNYTQTYVERMGAQNEEKKIQKI